MINNEFYKHLGDAWFTAEGDAVALLRIENETKAPWVLGELREHIPGDGRVLDLGCGGGFLSLRLRDAGYRVTAVDVDQTVTASGRARDPRGDVAWVVGDARRLDFADRHFDAVCVMDVLEHIADWRAVIAEATRVVRPGGIVLFHTFNRTALSWIFAARGLDWFLKGSAKNIHQWRMFITPGELAEEFARRNYRVVKWRGIQPRFFTRAFLRLIFTRRVPKTFSFCLGKSLRVGYLGAALSASKGHREA